MFIAASSKVHAQQDPLYAQYLNNPIVLNPAYAGSNQMWQTQKYLFEGYQRMRVLQDLSLHHQQ